MKAWRVSHHGGLEALEWIEVAKPEPTAGEVRIRVEALGLNHLDLWLRKGVEGHRFPLPLIPGCDVTGLIDSLGEGTEAPLKALGLNVGSPVIVNPGTSCGVCEACLRGSDPLCASYGIFGETRNGGAAEFLTVPVANLIARPANISAVEAAALPIPFLTAWTMLHEKARLRAGEVVLIQAGGSGVSVAAIQMAKAAGATVVTTVGRDEKIEPAQKLGSDFVINYKKTKFREELRRVLAPLGRKDVDVAIDHVGVDTFNDSLRSLARGGRLVTCGATTGSGIAIDLKPIFFKNLSILGSTMGSKADLIRVIGLVAQGKLRPVVDSTFVLAEYNRAQARLESREAFGKIVVKV